MFAEAIEDYARRCAESICELLDDNNLSLDEKLEQALELGASDDYPYAAFFHTEGHGALHDRLSLVMCEAVRPHLRAALEADAPSRGAAARAANGDEFVSRLPHGYDTTIGENGARLSGGERQRISIARALLKDAPVVLLDEATASLDVENETKVQEALSRLLAGKTVIVIAHRMRTVMSADKIVVLEDGRVAEQGSPEELLAAGGLFARMVRLQTESADWTL